MRRIAAVAACAGVLSLVFAALPAGATPRLTPPALFAGWDGEFVKASQGSYCWSASICADYVYPLEIKRRLAVVGRSPLAIRVGARARSVKLTLLQVHDGDTETVRALRAKPASPSRRRWLTRLPADLGSASVLDVVVDYQHDRGTSDFWVGLKTGENISP